MSSQHAVEAEDPAVIEQRVQAYESIVSDKKNVLHALAINKANFFEQWAEDLEKLINAKRLKIQVNEVSSYIYRKLVDAGLRDRTPYAREVLPAKYKRHDQNPDREEILAQTISLNRVHCSKCNHIFMPTPAERAELRTICPKCKTMLTLPIDDPELENQMYIALVKAWIEALKILQDKLETEHFCMYLDPDDYYESMQTGFNLLQLLLEALDKRQKVPQATQHILIRMSLKHGIDNAAGFYFSYVRQDLFDLTRKETRNIVTKMIDSCHRKNGEYDFTKIKENKGKLHLALEPRNIDLAAIDGFYPSKCPTCAVCRSTSKYRAAGVVEIKCEGCKTFYTPPHIGAYKNRNNMPLLTASGPCRIENNKVVDSSDNELAVILLPQPSAPADQVGATHGPK